MFRFPALRLSALLPVLLLAVACVSSRLAESNLSAVTALAETVVALDPAAIPQAQTAVDDAAAIVDATPWYMQLFNFGLPSELVEKNQANVDGLAAKLPQPTPEQKAEIERARVAAAKIAGKRAAASQVRAAVSTVPWLDALAGAISVVGGAIGTLYGLTRGRKHVATWWSTPTATQPAPPPPLPTDPGAPGPASPPATP